MEVAAELVDESEGLPKPGQLWQAWSSGLAYEAGITQTPIS